MKLRIFVISLVAALAYALPAWSVETVRVETFSGVPRLVVDGRPVRARVFFGIPGARPITIGPTPQLIQFEFQPLEDELERATMHLRFGQIAGRVLLDDIRIVDLSDGTDVVPGYDFEAGPADVARGWTYWPQGEQNTVGEVQVVEGVGRDGSRGLSVSLTQPAAGEWPDFHLFHLPKLALRHAHRYRVSFWVRAEQERSLTVAFYRPGEPFVYLGGPSGCFERQIKLAADVGVDLVSFPLAMPWPRPGETPDWTSVDRQCQAVIDANPDALLVPRIWTGPPRWWLAAHPDDAMLWDSTPQPSPDVVVASSQWRIAAAEHLSALIEHLEETMGSHMAGYHPTGQNTGEWFYQHTWGPALNGYAPSSLSAWRLWLAETYQTDAALQSAWRRDDVTLATAAIPSPELRRGAPYGLLRDPAREQSLIDFARFQQQMMSETVCHFAGVVRQATRGRKLVVFFYGYTFEFGAIRDGAAISGHYGLRRVLDSPDIDVLCSPISYFDRALGGSGPAMTAAESVALAGKMWLVEDDTYTLLGTGTFPGWQDGVDNIEDTNRLLLRNTGQCALRNFATWWMDLGGTGWFDDPRMWAEMARLEALDEPLLQRPRPFHPAVAAVVDEDSMLHAAGGSFHLTRPLVYESRRPLGRLGAPYGQYLLDDVVSGRVPAKMLVFLAAWSLSDVQRQKLLDTTDGALKVWCYAPGGFDSGQFSLEAMRQLTGFQYTTVSVDKAWAEPTERGRQLGLRHGLGVDGTIRPLFAVADARPEEVLATYSDGSTAIALRKTPHGTSLFVGPPVLTAELLRLAADEAGVHLYTRSDCNVYANGPYLVLHAADEGVIEVDTGNAEPIVDLLNGTSLGSGPRLKLNLQKGETKVLRVGNDPPSDSDPAVPGADRQGR